MVNSTRPPPPPLDEHAQRLFEQARFRRQQATEALDQFEQAMWNVAWDRGYVEGWQVGRESAFHEMELLRNRQPVEADPQPPREAAPTPPALIEEEPSSSAQDLVWQIVQQHPGLRGVEIVAATETAGRPVKERTVRTALHRLKKDGLIINRDERWYPPEAAPGGLQEGDLD